VVGERRVPVEIVAFLVGFAADSGIETGGVVSAPASALTAAADTTLTVRSMPLAKSAACPPAIVNMPLCKGNASLRTVFPGREG
jgi:hypothetical protein